MSESARIRPPLKHRARQLRRELTDAERALWRHLRQRQVAGLRFRRQHPLGRYIVDFACLDARLVIEVDGGQHGEREDYDEERTAWLQQRGFRVLRFWNNELLNNIYGVMERITEAIRIGSQPPS